MGNGNSNSKTKKKSSTKIPLEDDNSHPPEIKEFIKKHRQPFPCSLLFKDNDIHINDSCFVKIYPNKISYNKVNQFKSNLIKIEKSLNITGNILIQNDLDINTIHNEFKFKQISNNVKEQKIEQEVFCYKYILAELTIRPEDISFSDYIKEQLKEIAESDYNDIKKAKTIDDELKQYGFYVPTKIEIGGMFSVKTDNLKEDIKRNLKRNFGANINYCYGENKSKYDQSGEQIVKNIFSQTSKDVKGGNSLEDDYEKWKNSITIENAEIVGYSNFMKGTNFFFKEFKKNLSGAINILNRKYEARKKFYEIIEKLKNIKSSYNFKDRKDTYQEGICKPNEYPKIELLNNEQKGDGEFAQQIKRRFSSSFEHIIVGWKIVSVWTDGTNGTWSLDQNPLLTNRIDVNFISKYFRGERFRIELWMMSLPDEEWTNY